MAKNKLKSILKLKIKKCSSNNSINSINNFICESISIEDKNKDNNKDKDKDNNKDKEDNNKTSKKNKKNNDDNKCKKMNEKEKIKRFSLLQRSNSSSGEASSTKSPKPVFKKQHSDIPIATSEVVKISQQLDKLAQTSQNPLLGDNSDSEDSDSEEPSRAQAYTKSLGSSRRRSNSDVTALSLDKFKNSIDVIAEEPPNFKLSSKVSSVVTLQRAISTSEEKIAAKASDLSQSFSFYNEETKLNILKLDLDSVTQQIQVQEEKLHALLNDFERDKNKDMADFEREARKVRDEINKLELKQWKIYEKMDKISSKEENNEIKEQDENGRDIKIFSVSQGKRTVSAATVDVLISLLVEEGNLDMDYVDDFLVTYRMYISSQELLTKLMDMFQKTESKNTAIYRWMAVLKKWVERCYRIDFDLSGNTAKLEEFYQILLPYLKEAGKQSDFDLIWLMKHITQSSNYKSNYDLTNLKSIDISQDDGKKNGTSHKKGAWEYLGNALTLEEICEALARQEYELYINIKPEEFLERLIWKGEESEINPKTENLNAMIHWFNQIGIWFTTSVCVTYDLKERVKTLCKFIEIAKRCHTLGCYNTVFSIITSMSSSSVSRLKKTWEEVPKKLLATFHELEELCNPQHNYKKYRTIEATSAVPIIPYIGMHMRDVLFSNDGNPSKVGQNLLSFQKLRNLLKCANNALSHQKRVFYIPINRQELRQFLEFVKNMKTLQERHLYKLSCLCEPPVWKKKSFFMLYKRNQEI